MAADSEIVGEEESFYSETGQTIDQEVDSAFGQVRGIGESIDPVNKVSELYSDIPSMPMAFGVTGDDLASVYEKPESTKFDKILQDSTGVSVGDFHPKKLFNFLGDKLGGLKDLIVGQLLACLKDLIMKGLRKVTFIRDFDMEVGQAIGGIKRKVEDEVDKAIKNAIYRKLQIQQLAAFNKEITKKIRSICQDQPKDVRDIGNDFTKAEYDAEQGAIIVLEELKRIGQEQASGYPSRSTDMYVNGDGTIKTTQQRLSEAFASLSSLESMSPAGGSSIPTVEETVAMKSLIKEIAELKQRETDESNLSEVNC